MVCEQHESGQWLLWGVRVSLLLLLLLSHHLLFGVVLRVRVVNIRLHSILWVVYTSPVRTLIQPSKWIPPR